MHALRRSVPSPGCSGFGSPAGRIVAARSQVRWSMVGRAVVPLTVRSTASPPT